MQDGSDWPLIILVNVAFFAAVFLLYRWRGRQKEAAVRAGVGEEFERNKARASAFANLLAGAALTGAALWTWPSLPRGNEAVFAVMLAGGVFFVLYGLFKWYRLRR